MLRGVGDEHRYAGSIIAEMVRLAAETERACGPIIREAYAAYERRIALEAENGEPDSAAPAPSGA